MDIETLAVLVAAFALLAVLRLLRIVTWLLRLLERERRIRFRRSTLCRSGERGRRLGK